jgi:hypothetical protein
MTTPQPISEVRPFGSEDIIPVGKYALLAVRKVGDQFTIVFTDEERLYLMLCPAREIVGVSFLDGVTSIIVDNTPNELSVQGERFHAFPESTSGYILELYVEEDPDMYTALRVKRPLTVICAFVKDGQSLLILKSSKGRYLLKKFTLNSLNQTGWDSVVSNDGTNNYVYEIARNGEVECIHQPE